MTRLIVSRRPRRRRRARQLRLDLAHAQAAGVHRQDLVVQARQAGLALGHQPRRKARVTVTRRADRDVAEIGRERLRGRPVADVGRAAGRRLARPVAQVLAQLAAQRGLDHPARELRDQPAGPVISSASRPRNASATPPRQRHGNPDHPAGWARTWPSAGKPCGRRLSVYGEAPRTPVRPPCSLSKWSLAPDLQRQRASWCDECCLNCSGRLGWCGARCRVRALRRLRRARRPRCRVPRRATAAAGGRAPVVPGSPGSRAAARGRR